MSESLDSISFTLLNCKAILDLKFNSTNDETLSECLNTSHQSDSMIQIIDQTIQKILGYRISR